MKKKASHRWLDAQVVISTLSMTASLGLWRLFAVAPQPVAASLPPTPTGPAVVESTPAGVQAAPLVALPSTRILLGGAAPRPPSVNSGGGPAPVTSTGSSRP
jgi:hypothetical protein